MNTSKFKSSLSGSKYDSNEIDNLSPLLFVDIISLNPPIGDTFSAKLPMKFPGGS